MRVHLHDHLREPGARDTKCGPENSVATTYLVQSLTYSHVGRIPFVLDRPCITNNTNHLASTKPNQPLIKRIIHPPDKEPRKKYNHDSLPLFLQSPYYTLQCFVAVGDQRQHASPDRVTIPRGWSSKRRTIHTIVKPRGGEKARKGGQDGREKKGERYTWKRRRQQQPLARVSYATQKAVTESHDARELIQKQRIGRGERGESTRHGERKKANRSRPKSAANWLVRGCFGPLNASREAPGSGTPASRRSRSGGPLVGGIKRWA